MAKNKNRIKHEHRKKKHALHDKRCQNKPMENGASMHSKYISSSLFTSSTGSLRTYTLGKLCKHPPLKIQSTELDSDNKPLIGTLTGGEDRKQRIDAALYVCLDSLRLPDELIDSQGELKGLSTQRVVYFPITDMSTPYVPYLDKVLELMNSYLMRGKHVHVHCIGGHGRTGTVLACYLGKYTSIDKPIAYLRQNYCKEAVESLSQHDFIASYTGCNEPEQHRSLSYTKYVSSWKEYLTNENSTSYKYDSINDPVQEDAPDMIGLKCPACNTDIPEDYIWSDNYRYEYLCTRCGYYFESEY